MGSCVTIAFIMRAEGNGIVLGQQGLQGVILHAVIVLVQGDHIIHIGLESLRIAVALSLVQIFNDAIRNRARGGIMHNLILVDILTLVHRLDAGIRGIRHAIGHIDDLNRDLVLLAGKRISAHLMLVIRDGYVDQGEPFFSGHLGRVADLHQAIGATATLMADDDADIHILADVILGQILFVDLQPHEVVDIVGLFQLDGILVIARFALHKGHTRRRTIIVIGGIGHSGPGVIVLVGRLDQAYRPGIQTFRVHLHPAVLRIVRRFRNVIVEGILIQRHIVGDCHRSLRPGPAGHGHQRPAQYLGLLLIPNPGAHIVAAAKRRVRGHQLGAGNIVGIDVDQIGFLLDGIHDVRTVAILHKIVLAIAWESIIIQSQ